MSNIRGKYHVVLLLAVALLAAPVALAAGPFPDEGEGQLSDVLDDGRTMYWRMLVEHEAVVLTVKTPCGPIERLLPAGKEIVFNPAEEVYPDSPDGTYTWQIRIVPVVDPEVRETLQKARATGDDELVADLRRKGLLPKGPFLQTGSFTVQEGGIVARGEVEETSSKSLEAVRSGAAGDLGGAAAATGDAEVVTAADVVYNDDVIIQRSLCVGFDCVNGESFSFDTIRLKENNLRIKFQDTSGGSFPSRDWEIEANSSANGGQSHFRINDVDGARSPFTIEAAAPSHSLYVDSSGRIGRKTANPILELHIVDGDTPAIRLEQDTSSGFQAQVWDVAGNETNFFVRDATSGSTLPFKIRPGASSNTLVVSGTSNVGIGTLSPAQKLHVVGNAQITGSLIEPVTIGISGAVQPTLARNSEGGLTVSTNGATAASADLLRVATSGGTPVFQVEASGAVFVNSSQVHPDYVFTEDYRLESIEEHARSMWENKHLPAVGPGVHDENGRALIDIGGKTLGMLEELEKAHIYIEQLHQRLVEKDRLLQDVVQRLERLEHPESADGNP